MTDLKDEVEETIPGVEGDWVLLIVQDCISMLLGPTVEPRLRRSRSRGSLSLSLTQHFIFTVGTQSNDALKREPSSIEPERLER